MRWLRVLGASALLLPLTGMADAGPVLEPMGTYVKVEAGIKSPTDPIEFKGGERACVMLIGDHDPVMDLALYVYDERRRLVASDTAGGDIVAVTWYPAVDGRYTIERENKGGVWNKCYFVVK